MQVQKRGSGFFTRYQLEMGRHFLGELNKMLAELDGLSEDG